MSRDEYTLDDARNYGFELLELYKLWHWNSCLPFAAQHDEIEQRINSISNEVKERFIPLPVDADGVPIHVGDVLYEEGDEPFEVYAFKVCEMMPSKTNGWELFGGVDGEGFSAYNPATCRHYHKPTIEDVLREMLEKAVGFSYAHTTVALNAIAEYAAKLREVMVDDDEAR